VIVAAGGAVTRPLIDAGVQVPVVFAFSGDVVIGKVVDSYAHPGNNRTGVSFFSLELVPKRLELMKEVLPGSSGWPSWLAAARGEPMELQAAAGGAAKLGLAHEYHPVTSETEVVAALDRILRWRADAILAFADAITISHAERIAAFSIQHRIPAVSSWAVFAEKGNLLAYGPICSTATGACLTSWTGS